MTYKQINTQYNKVCELIYHRQLKEAFDELSKLVSLSGNGDHRIELENHEETYRNILKYSFEQVEDPQKEVIYKKLLKQVLELTDQVAENIVDEHKLLSVTNIKRHTIDPQTLTEERSEEIIDRLEFSSELQDLLSETGGISGNTGRYNEEEIRSALVSAFNLFRVTGKYNDALVGFGKRISLSPNVAWYNKSVIVSAITLSLLRRFDEAKVLLLFDFFDQQDDQVWQRALAGLVTVLNRYDRRISYYPAITEKLHALKGNKDLERNIQDLIIQFIKSKETEKITKKFQEEIVPEMIKLRPRLEDKLDLENLISESDMEDKNPDWETFFKDSPDLLSKLEEFSQLQIEGSDVFMSAFSMLKQFSFFDELINWFMPFHKDNNEVEQYFHNMKEDFDADSFLDGLQKTAYLCNSDKYSFCLNVNRMPAMQRDAMLDMFKMEMQAMQEISKEEEILDKPVKDKMVFTQYLQDLYRFFKIHPLKNEFFDIFNMRFDLHNTYFFNVLVKDPAIIRNIAEFYFSRDYYEEALEIFSEIMKDNEDYELLQKTGYCYQQLDQYEKAIEYYKKAEYFEKNKSWVLKKIAFCYRKLKHYPEALEYFKQVESLEPENLYIQTMLGRTYLDLDDYETALKYYFKVEYLQPENHKVRRPIGWCSFLLGRFENARKYFIRIPENAINEYDYLNLGHVEWCLGNKKSAIGYYRKALAASGKFEWFAAEFDNDKKYLIKFGIDKLDIPLMLDFLRFDSENNQ